MSKQSSVEWLYEQLTLTWYDYESGKDILKQAKEMEKEQIIDSFKIGNHTEMRGGKILLLISEQYYNETYGGDK
jgi:hypothetical protein